MCRSPILMRFGHGSFGAAIPLQRRGAQPWSFAWKARVLATITPGIASLLWLFVKQWSLQSNKTVVAQDSKLLPLKSLRDFLKLVQRIMLCSKDYANLNIWISTFEYVFTSRPFGAESVLSKIAIYLAITTKKDITLLRKKRMSMSFVIFSSFLLGGTQLNKRGILKTF